MSKNATQTGVPVSVQQKNPYLSNAMVGFTQQSINRGNNGVVPTSGSNKRMPVKDNYMNSLNSVSVHDRTQASTVMAVEKQNSATGPQQFKT